MCFGIEITPKKIHFKEKQKMKKLGLIILMALVLTVGGVYATFDYAQKEVALVTQDLTTSIAGKDTETRKGTISVETNFKIRIDDTTGTLKTGYTTEGNTTITFTPATKGVDDDVVNNGVNLKFVLNINGTNEYNGTPIFKTKQPAYTAGGVELGKGTKNNVSGAFEYTVDLSKYLEVSEISLPTEAAYDAFLAVFETIRITITVSEVPPVSGV